MSTTPTKQLNITDLHTILRNYLKTTDFRYVSHSLRSLSGEVEGYLSEHYSLDIQYETTRTRDATTMRHSKQFFVKALLNEDNMLATLAKQLDAFERESFLYETLFKQFEQFTEYKQIVPRCYLARKNLIVLEDLKAESFFVGERLTCYTLQQCQVALEALANYHAYSIVLEQLLSTQSGEKYRLNEAYPELLNDIHLDINTPSDNISKQFHEASYDCLLQLIDVLIADITTQIEFKQLLTQFQENETLDIKYNHNYRSTCVHGDLWSHNIMFNVDECRLVDFQMLRYALPAFDVQLFFFSNTTTSFQSQHKTSLMNHYHAHLNAVLVANGVHDVVVTFKDLIETCVLKGPEAKMQAVNDLAMLHMPKELLDKAQVDADLFKSLLLRDRSRFVMEQVRKDPDFKTFMTAELHHLFLLLKERNVFIKSLKNP